MSRLAPTGCVSIWIVESYSWMKTCCDSVVPEDWMLPERHGLAGLALQRQVFGRNRRVGLEGRRADGQARSRLQDPGVELSGVYIVEWIPILGLIS